MDHQLGEDSPAEVELTGATKAEIEVLRADGSLASKSAIELTPAADRLARGN